MATPINSMPPAQNAETRNDQMNGTMKSGTTMATSQGVFARKECFKNLKSGIGSVFAQQKPDNEMMDAILLSKRMDDQKQ